MAERIIIEGGVVTRVREEEIGQFTLEEFLQQTQQVLVTPILPTNCVYYRKRGVMHTVLIQHAPQKRSIRVKETRSDWRTYELELPWMVNVHYIESAGSQNGRSTYKHGGLKATFRSRPLMEDDRVLKLCPLPNVFADNANVCLGHQLDNARSNSLQEMVTIAEGCLFSTDFNTEVSPDPEAWRLVGGSFEAWERLSRAEIVSAVNNLRWSAISGEW